MCNYSYIRGHKSPHNGDNVHLHNVHFLTREKVVLYLVEGELIWIMWKKMVVDWLFWTPHSIHWGTFYFEKSKKPSCFRNLVPYDVLNCFTQWIESTVTNCNSLCNNTSNYSHFEQRKHVTTFRKCVVIWYSIEKQLSILEKPWLFHIWHLKELPGDQNSAIIYRRDSHPPPLCEKLSALESHYIHTR